MILKRGNAMRLKKCRVLGQVMCGALLIGALGGESLEAKETTTRKRIWEEQVQKQYDIGSISKVFTATAVMQLVEQGKVTLDAPLTDYIPEFTMKDVRYKKITPRMLLNHTSGLMGSHFKNSMLFEDNDTWATDHLLEALKEERLKNDPGTYATYCNDGFTLAEILVERVSGMSFSDYLAQNILNPLNMTQTGTPQRKSKEAVLQAGTYEANGYKLPHEYCNLIGSGGILSTTEDLSKFATLFMKNGPKNVLTADSKSAMTTNEKAKNTYLNLSGDSIFEYGLGFDSVEVYPFNKYGIQVLSKGGSVNYQQGNLTIAPDYDCSVAVLSAGGEGQYDAYMSQEILMAVLQEKGVISSEATKESLAEDWNKQLTYSKIPGEVKAYKGFYSGAAWYEISFPNDMEMEVKSFDSDQSISTKFKYVKEGFFVNEESYYFDGQMLTRQREKGKVASRVWFKEEADKNVYLCSQSYMEKEGFGVYSQKDNELKSQEANPISEKVKAIWEKRCEKTYYPIYDKYSSTNWPINTYEKLQLTEGIAGYVQGTGAGSRVGISKIIDESTAHCAGLTRDMTDIQFEKEGQNEYLTIGGKDYRYISEEQLKGYEGQRLTAKAAHDQTVIWYKIGDKAVGMQKSIHIEGEGAVYVYNSYHHCIYSTMRTNGSEVVVMPEGGTMVFVGEKGAVMEIE